MKIKYSKLSQNKILQLKKTFLLNASARKTAETLKLNRNTVNRYFKIFRKNISKKQQKLSGEVEIDEMYYGKKKGSIGRNTNDKVIIKKVDNSKAKTLIPPITVNVSKNTTIYSDSFKTYNQIDKEGYTQKKINHMNL